jgi:hypothetical protein
MASETEDFLASEYGTSLVSLETHFGPNDENKCHECTLRKLVFLRTEIKNHHLYIIVSYVRHHPKKYELPLRHMHRQVPSLKVSI